MYESRTLQALAALSDATRLRVVRFLAAAGSDGAAAGVIGAEVGAQPSRLSFHLAVLAQAGLVTPTRVSRQVIYRVDFDALGRLMGDLIEDCCGGHPKVRDRLRPTSDGGT